MKKVIIVLLFTFLFIPICEVKAINSFDLPINQNVNINSITEKYKWYKLKEVDSREESVFERSCEYLEIKETDFSPWSEEKPEEKYGRIIEEKIESNKEEVKYSAIMIDNVFASNLRTQEIKLFDDNWNQIKYSSIKCYNCTSTFPKENLFDNNYSTYFEVKYNQPLILILDEETTKNIRVQFFYEKEDYLFGFRVSKLDKKYNILESKEETIETLRRLSSETYSSYINSDKVKWSNNTSVKYYRYKDAYLLCHEREYLDDYYEFVENYIKDENQNMKYYDYDSVYIEPEIIEKEVFKEIIIPKEKIIYEYIEASNDDSCEYETVLKKTNTEYKDNSKVLQENQNKRKITKRDIKFFIIFSFILLIITVLCLIMKELIKKCR